VSRIILQSTLPASELNYGLDKALPDQLIVGRGNVLYLTGWCFHKEQSISQLEVSIYGITQAVATWSLPRSEAESHGQRSGFWALLTVPEQKVEMTVEVELQAHLRDGRRVRVSLGQLRLCLQSEAARIEVEAPYPTEGPLVAICMATYDPPLELLQRQMQSIVAQNYHNWICVISDDASRPELLAEIARLAQSDARFVLCPAPHRLGFYHNFERCLTLAPAAAEFIALADQDDYWYPDKLWTLLAHADAASTLVYSDMRIVNAEGAVLADTYWVTRRNNYTNLTSLLLANTVTGAASLFPRRLLDYALPFPPQVGNLYHDHWLACVARTTGRLKYVQRALYDYTQHAGNVLGHQAAVRMDLPHLIYYSMKNLTTTAGRWEAQEVYDKVVLKIELMARVLLLRSGPQMRWRRRWALRWLARLERSPLACLWLALRGLRDWRRVSVTIGAEYQVLMGIAWKHYWLWKERWDVP
jgi:glycosyltransferase involved in cell wall biosynthesis